MNLKNYLRYNLLPAKQRKLKVEEHKEEIFLVILGADEIGRLSFINGNWKFEYSETAKRKDVRHLAGFPNFNKAYESKQLWPFFLSRIPSLSRKRIQKTVEEEGIEEDDLLSLLKRFGSKTFTNPYELTSA